MNSESAFAVRLYLEKVHLRPMEKLFFYTLDSNNIPVGIDGAFTDYHNTIDSYMVSPSYKGSKIIMEYNGPSFLELPTFKLSFLSHGFRKQSGGINDETLECHNDVNCSQENPWCNEIRSVCKISVSRRIPVYKNRVTGELLYTRVFTWSGSGALLNNSNNDFKPLILTARHVIRCPTIYVQKNDTNQQEPNHGLANGYVEFERTVFEFNFQHRECDNGYNSIGNRCGTFLGISINFRETSCKLLEDESGVGGCELALLEMTNKPPLQYNVYYAGWDRHKISDIEGNDVTGIHHPKGDLKKISHGEIDRNFLGISAKVAVDWTNGITQKGSSGSPLFRNDTRRVIGALSWGYNDNCNDLAQRDRYGKLRAFWGKVKDDLSPDNHDRNWFVGNDPLGACQNHIELNNRFIPSSIYRLAKPDILIQAAQSITIANKARTDITNLCIDGQTFNSNYTFTANNSISIKGNGGGFSIQSGATVSLKIQPCGWFGNCEQNYYSAPPAENKTDKTVSYDRLYISPNVSVYPNPSDGSIKINIRSESILSECEIYNSIGKLVYSLDISNSHQSLVQIPIDNLANGIFFIKVKSIDGTISNHKFIKN